MDQNLSSFFQNKLEFSQQGFTVVRRYFSKDVLDFIHKNFLLLEQHHLYDNEDEQIKKGIIFNHTDIGKVVSFYFLNLVSFLSEKQIVSTYNYSRCYLNGAELLKHVDRESCEYSVTLCIKKDTVDYPIFFEDKNKNVIELELEEGDFIFYKGQELAHWREPFLGDKHYQMFLHYVDENGLNKYRKNEQFFKNTSSYA